VGVPATVGTGVADTFADSVVVALDVAVAVALPVRVAKRGVDEIVADVNGEIDDVVEPDTVFVTAAEGVGRTDAAAVADDTRVRDCATEPE